MVILVDVDDLLGDWHWPIIFMSAKGLTNTVGRISEPSIPDGDVQSDA